MIKTIADGKFRFALLHDWIAAHLVPPSWIDFARQECPRHTLPISERFPQLIMLIRLFFASICMYNPARLDFI